MHDWVLDIRTGLRQLRRAPGVSIAAVLTLAVGIGATTAAVSLVAAVMAVSRSVPDLERRVALWSHNRGDAETKRAVSPGDFLDWRRRATSVEQMVAIRERSLNLAATAVPMRVAGSEVSPDYLEFFQLTPTAGRSFTEDDARQGAPRVAILSESFWRTQLGSREDLVGQTVRIDGEPTTIIGVLPRSVFSGIFVPLRLENLEADRSNRSLFVWARLKPGIEIGEARAEMESLGQTLEREYPETNRGWTINTRPLEEEFVGPQARLALALLVGMAFAVLLIGCINIANLLLARGVARRGEIAVRMALGASAWRIVRQLFVESAILAAIGAAASLVAARWMVALLVSILPLESPWLEGGWVNVRVLAVTAIGALVATMAAGLMPALAARRTSLALGMHAAGRSGIAGSRGRLTRVLVVGQVTLAAVLLIVAGLLNRSLVAVQRLEAGFDVGHLLTARVALPAATSNESAARWFAGAIERAGGIPGVVGAAGASRLPFAGSRFNPNRGLVIEGRVDSRPDEGAFAIDYVVTPGYFETMKLPIREGREFTHADGGGAPYAAVVSETLAARYWPGRSAVGGRLRQGDEPPGIWRTIVGVAGDVRNDDADQPPLPYLYLPLAQQPERALSMVIRTAGEPDALADTLRRAMAEFDPDQPLFDVRSMEAILDADLRQTVVLIRILNALAVFALALAAIGIWGVVSQLLAERTREIGIRIALGATASHVVALIARLGLLPVAVGLIVGLTAGLGVARLLRSLLFQVTPTDPVTLAATCAFLGIAAAIALVDPLRRALRLDPAQVLRMD